MKKRLTFATVLLALLVPAAAAQAAEPISGAGSTFAAKIIAKWASDVAPKGVKVTYQAVGSGDGRAALIAGKVDFAAAHGPAPAAEVAKLKAKYGGVVHVPETSGGIAVVYNVKGVTNLKLSGPTLAKIFSGAVKKWNDAAIAVDNGAPGPNLPIKVFVRSDKSGSSGVFTGYLSAAGGGAWKGGTTETFPTGAGRQGRDGGSALAAAVAATNGAIGYVDHGTAVGKKLREALVKNRAGQFRPPAPANVSAAINEATTRGDGTLGVTYTPKSGNAYPISTVSYVVAPAKLRAAKAQSLKAFLGYALSNAGQGRAAPLGYAPLPGRLRTFANQQVGKITGR